MIVHIYQNHSLVEDSIYDNNNSIYLPNNHIVVYDYVLSLTDEGFNQYVGRGAI